MLAHVGYVPLRVSPYLGPASFRPTYGESGPSDDCVAWWMSSMWAWVWKKRKSAKGHYRFWAFASWAAVSSIWHAAVSGEASCILLSLWLWKLTWSQEPKTPRTIHPLFSIILKVDKITLYYEFTSVLRTPWILSHFLPKSNNMVGNHTTKNTMHDIKFKEQKKKKKKRSEDLKENVLSLLLLFGISFGRFSSIERVEWWHLYSKSQTPTHGWQKWLHMKLKQRVD